MGLTSSVLCHLKKGTISGFLKLRKEIGVILAIYIGETGRYPMNMTDLLSNESASEQLNRLFFPFERPNLTLLAKDTTEVRFSFVLYAWGWDNDDDELRDIYDLAPKTASSIFMDGDILIKDGYTTKLY